MITGQNDDEEDISKNDEREYISWYYCPYDQIIQTKEKGGRGEEGIKIQFILGKSGKPTTSPILIFPSLSSSPFLFPSSLPFIFTFPPSPPSLSVEKGEKGTVSISNMKQKEEQLEVAELYFHIVDVQNEINRLTCQVSMTEEQIRQTSREKQYLLARIDQLNDELLKLIFRFDFVMYTFRNTTL